MILDDILKEKRRTLALDQACRPLTEIEALAQKAEATRNFARALEGGDIQLIAEVKKASPSRGLLRPDFDPVALAQGYARGGAAAISVLTESHYFKGSLEHMAAVRRAVDLPLLRKDFLFTPYQVYEARAFGADAILLIATILSREQIAELLMVSRKLGMAALVETHNPEEVGKALAAGARIIGINNRDLHTFEIDLSVTERLRRLIPPDRLVVSESGFRCREDVRQARGWGVDAILVGEALVTAPDVSAKIKELLGPD